MEKKLRRSNLEFCFKRAVIEKANYFAVMIRRKDLEEVEVIIEPIKNISKKKEYYMSQYDENLVSIINGESRIVGLSYGDTFDEIECDFFEVEL